MNRWFTSDQHFDHANIIRYCGRPFDSPEEMNSEIIARWNSVVADDDEVYILGDFAMGHKDESVSYAAKLNGTKYLIPGNHDGVWEGNGDKRVQRWTPLYESAGFIVAPPGLCEKLSDGTTVMMSHFPYHDIERHADRFDGDWNPIDDGKTWLIHGHVHQAWRVDRPRRQINVGVDMWDFYPVHEDTIAEIISG
jgi:calcineurin-like phosphoesterase family protein